MEGALRMEVRTAIFSALVSVERHRRSSYAGSNKFHRLDIENFHANSRHKEADVLRAAKTKIPWTERTHGAWSFSAIL